MTKIVYNKCYGGFGLSNEAIELYLQLKNIPFVKATKDRYPCQYYTFATKEQAEPSKRGIAFDDYAIPRNDPALVAVVEQLGATANSSFANLAIIDLPTGTRYFIDEYDGYESVQTEESITWSIA